MLKLSLDRDYKAAIYLRLSKEDGDFSFSGEKLESDSISNQRLLIMDYLRKHPEITVVKEYCDDGFTGANFERPDFNKMMDAVRAGEIDCIVVKDLSRFGREYIGSGEYIQKIFPRLGIRIYGKKFVAPPIGTTTEALVRAFIGENPHWRKFCLKP